ncbi:MAG TPA: alkaline phosphatase family protein [Candidatus Limnocylindrales bacterium]|nr:alkaline phosphatase family protein [Candidatus Limnocylindrales bacterium]
MTARRARGVIGGVALSFLLVGGVGPRPAGAAEDPPTRTPIKHFVTLMQENHTFDNYFGTYAGANGIPPGVCMPEDPEVQGGPCVTPFPMNGQPALDLGHSRLAFDDQYRNGAMDGFVAAQGGSRTVMGYYNDQDLPYYYNIADQYVLFDNWFSSSGGGSLQNHFYWIAGAPGAAGESIPPEGIDIPVVFDRLQAAGISWKFYIQNYDPTITFRGLEGEGDRASQVVWAPILTMPRYIDNPELMSHVVDMDQFYADLEAGTLPSVAYLVPSGASEHPPGSVRAGQRFVQTLINAIIRSQYWGDTAFTWTYDDWGGWYDHVPPPQVDQYGLGFRVPSLLVSSMAKQGYIDSTQHEFASIVRFITDNWNLASVGSRDAAASSIVEAFAFDQPPRAPFFVTTDRIPPEEREQPNRAVLYVAYGSSIAFELLSIAGAILVTRRRSRRASVS